MFSIYFQFNFNFVVLFLNLIHVHGSMCGFAYNPFFSLFFFNIWKIYLFLFGAACIIFSFDRDTLNVHMSIHNMTFGHLIKIGKRCLISSKNEKIISWNDFFNECITVTKEMGSQGCMSTCDIKQKSLDLSAAWKKIRV